MALVSPGIQVTVIDESQYVTAGNGTVPYILIATASNKVNAAGTGIAPGTLASAIGNTYLITSQRDLTSTFGNPFFYKTTNGEAIYGHELSEYGLMAAYSLLGITNRAYVQRVDVDLASLEGSLVRPRGTPSEGTYWLDTTETDWGLFVWNAATNTFDDTTVNIINDVNDLLAGVPLSSIGNVGEYAVVTTNANNPVYYKNSNNNWVLVGSDDWKSAVPTVIGSVSNPVITAGSAISINGSIVTASGTTVTSLSTDINNAAITGVTTKVEDGKLVFNVNTGGAGGDTQLVLADSVGTILSEIGITAGTYAAPILAHASHTQVPRWRATDTTPRPSGSVWVKTSAVDGGMSLIVKRFDSTTSNFVEQDLPLYASDQVANKWLDPGNGGRSIEVNTLYGQYDVFDDDTATVKIFRRNPGRTEITALTQNPVVTAGDKFRVQVSEPNSDTLTTAIEVTMSGTTPATFVSDWLAANIPHTLAEVTANNRVKITHTGGGVIVLDETYAGAGAAINAIGINDTIENVRTAPDGTLILSNWVVLDYIANSETPGLDPEDGTRWYYNAINDVDIMIQDNGVWRGYRNVSNDVRGYDLTVTNGQGPMIAVAAPTAQTDGTPLVYGDLWIDVSDLENYPKINRWESVNGVDRWVTLDNADQTSINGVLFADARWGNNDSIDPIADDLPTIESLLTSDYVDIDAPNPALYPPGTLLFNMRRSGFNVKEFRINYFNAQDFTSSVLPAERDAWVTVSGLRDDGSPNMGRQAQRALVVAAMKAAVDTNEDIREEQRRFNLMAAPGYPELVPNLVALNNERNNTAFIVGDTPMRLSTAGADIARWASNNSGQGLPTGDGMISNDEYVGMFYPSGKTTDLSGTEILVPPSHMILRTIVHSDEQSYPWLAPAGTRRGVIDNAIAIGYLDAATGEFQQKGIREGVRDVLYTNKVNPITVLPGAGILNFGNKTTSSSNSALDRINVARLVAYIRGQLEIITKPFLFEPNDEITRNEVKNVVESLLNDLVAKRGVADYSVVCDRSNNTPDRIDRNELWCDVAIVPVKAVEFIYIPVRIRNTGEI